MNEKIEYDTTYMIVPNQMIILTGQDKSEVSINAKDIKIKIISKHEIGDGGVGRKLETEMIMNAKLNI